MAENKTKYDLRVSDAIPIYGLLNYISRTTANPCDENSMRELRPNLLIRGVNTLGLIAANATVLVVLAKSLENSL